MRRLRCLRCLGLWLLDLCRLLLRMAAACRSPFLFWDIELVAVLVMAEHDGRVVAAGGSDNAIEYERLVMQEDECGKRFGHHRLTLSRGRSDVGWCQCSGQRCSESHRGGE